MEKYEELEFDDSYSELIKGTKDTQLAPGVNTVFDCAIETIQLYQDNVVELLLRFRLQAYPGQLPDKYTFHAEQRFVIKDTYGAFYANPFNDDMVELFAHLYIAGLEKFVNQFKLKLSEAGTNFYKNEPIVYDEHTKGIALKLLQFYYLKTN
jgi:hypothetical protein